MYGIGEFGLPINVPEARKAYAKQLKGYLLFFEQLIANFLAQLAQVDQLFSIDENTLNTYFNQLPDDIPRLKEIVGDLEHYKAELDALVAHHDDNLDRKNRFLDHLMARFCEDFDTSYLITQSHALNKQGVIIAKAQFLQNYPFISTNRAKGFNYSLPLEDRKNIAPVQQKIGILFNIEHYNPRQLTQAFTQGNLQEFEEDLANLDFQELPIDEAEGLKNNNIREVACKKSLEEEETEENIELDYQSEFIFFGEDDNLLYRLLQFGVKEEHYNIVKNTENQHYAVVFHAPDIPAAKVFEALSYQECQKAIKELIAYLEALNLEGEGFYLLEHLLLRSVLPPKYQLILNNDEGLPILHAYKAASLEQQQYVLLNLSTFGTQIDNYSLEKDENGYVGVLSDDNEVPIAKLYKKYEQLEDAEDAIYDLIDYLESTTDLQGKTNITSEGRPDLLLNSDFLSLRLSVMLPDWPKRFQQNHFRTLFEKIFNKNVPGHLAIDFYWLDVEEMMQFETLYEAWRREKALPSLSADLDDVAFRLIDFMLELNKD